MKWFEGAVKRRESVSCTLTGEGLSKRRIWRIWSSRFSKKYEQGRHPKIPCILVPALGWRKLFTLSTVSLTADVGAPNNVIQFPVFHFSGKPLSQCVWSSVCVCLCLRQRQKSWWSGGEEEIYRAGYTGSRI